MTRVKETIARHDKGYNCAQSVACTYADLVGLDEETMFKVTEGLGKGITQHREPGISRQQAGNL